MKGSSGGLGRSSTSPEGLDRGHRGSTLAEPSPSSASANEDQTPRSILRVQSSYNRVSPRIGARRRRRRRHVSFNAQEQVFLIPTRRKLKEEQRRALRRRKIRRQLTIRRRVGSIVSKGRKRNARTQSQSPSRGRQRQVSSRRGNRLGRARRRYFRARRRRRNARAEPNLHEDEETQERSQSQDNVEPETRDPIEPVVVSKTSIRHRQRANRRVSSKGLRPRGRTRLRSPPLSEEDVHRSD